MNKMILSGNEAIAKACFDVCVKVGVGYPGTPSTEILENFKNYEGVYTEWSVNEKVALEVGIGASLAGSRTLVTMKHVGVNVAADPLFTASYIGVKGGLVIVSADDPAMHSSQNEQDNRYYAKSSKTPMVDFSDSQDAYTFTKFALELSEKYDTPVFLRTTTRISHSKTIVIADDKKCVEKPVGFDRNPKKYVMIPAYAKQSHIAMEKKLEGLKNDASSFEINKVEINDKDIGFITSGIPYNYLKEVKPDASVLKLGIIYPLPEKLIKDFSSKFKKIIIVEELEPYFETEIKAMGINCEGKKYFPITGELSPDLVKAGLDMIENKTPGVKQKSNIEIQIPPRPPSLCPGCPHRQVFSVLNKKDVIISGDIGCYTLGVLPPFSSLDTCIDMGASITLAQGLNIVLKDNKKVVSVIGDSTFAHSGITGLINAAYNKRNFLMIVLDNGTTAMTGMQPNPFSGETIKLDEAIQVDYELLAASVGIKSPDFRIVDAYKDGQIETAITEMLASNRLGLLVIKGPCIILKAKKGKK